jgi:hypothetical protein
MVDVADIADVVNGWVVGSLEQPEIWVIQFDGKPVVLPNGKSLWRKKNHANCALTNAMERKSYDYPYVDRDTWSRQIKELRESGRIEIVRIK